MVREIAERELSETTLSRRSFRSGVDLEKRDGERLGRWSNEKGRGCASTSRVNFRKPFNYRGKRKFPSLAGRTNAKEITLMEACELSRNS